jgi:hypothetical protein
VFVVLVSLVLWISVVMLSRNWDMWFASIVGRVICMGSCGLFVRMVLMCISIMWVVIRWLLCWGNSFCMRGLCCVG